VGKFARPLGLPCAGRPRCRLANVLSGGEQRLLEISRALMMQPRFLLVDEPSIGLEPRYIDMVFEILGDLQRKEGKTIILVEQNAKKGLAFADIGYVLVAGRLALAGRASELLDNPEVGGFSSAGKTANTCQHSHPLDGLESVGWAHQPRAKGDATSSPSPPQWVERVGVRRGNRTLAEDEQLY
jgi:ABC-type multidrug transport system ATPase subunit